MILHCTAVFDIGKTNKKLIIFDEMYQMVHEQVVTFEEVKDEEGDNCEDLRSLTNWMLQSWTELERNTDFDIDALNFATYGASFVHLDANLRPVTPLYNYLKPLPADVENDFFKVYGDKMDFATATASPPLGMINSGMQLYWLKKKHPGTYKRIIHTLHFPQYCSFLFTQVLCSEFTSIGCHTGLWDMAKNDYHRFVYEEGFHQLFPPISKTYSIGKTKFRDKQIPVGTGLHDSSAALIPYLRRFTQPFVLLSTGTWCIALNPFAKKLLSKSELLNDCLNYLTFTGNQVKASRLFLGNFHEKHTKRFAGHFFKDKDYYKHVRLTNDILAQARRKPTLLPSRYDSEAGFDPTVLDQYASYEEAYHKLLDEMTDYQTEALYMAGENFTEINTVYVDGGFNKNDLFMKLLQQKNPTLSIEAFEIGQGTSLGAAMVMKEM